MPQGMPQGAPQAPQAPQQAAPQLPEEQGIGTLPAQNLQGMAGGGITGEAKLEHHYAQNGFVQDPNRYLTVTTPGAMGGAQYYYDIPSNPRLPVDPSVRALQGQYFPTREAALAAVGQPAQAQPSVSTASQGIANLLAPEQPDQNQTAINNTFPGANSGQEPPTNESVWSPNIEAPEIKSSGVALGPKPTAEAAKARSNIFFNPDEAIKNFRDDVTETGTVNQQNAAALAEMIANRPKLGAKAEARLKEEESKEPQKLDDLKSTSMLEAGLAMMAGTSPYALANIGKGGAEGVKSYKEGLKEIQKAHDLRQQAFDHIDDMRDAQTIGDQNLFYRSKEKASDKMLAARQHATTGIASVLGISGQMSSHAYENDTNNYMANQRTNAEMAQRAVLGNAQLQIEAAKMNKPPEAIQTYLYLGNGDMNLGMQKAQDLARDKSGVAVVTEFEKVNNERRKNGDTELSMDDFLAHLRQGIAGMQAPRVVNSAAPGSVLSRPGI